MVKILQVQFDEALFGRDMAKWVMDDILNRDLYTFHGVQISINTFADASFFSGLKLFIQKCPQVFKIKTDCSSTLENLHLVFEGSGLANFAKLPWLQRKYRVIYNEIANTGDWICTTELRSRTGARSSTFTNRLILLYARGFLLKRRVSRVVGGFEYQWLAPFGMDI